MRFMSYHGHVMSLLHSLVRSHDSHAELPALPILGPWLSPTGPVWAAGDAALVAISHTRLLRCIIARHDCPDIYHWCLPLVSPTHHHHIVLAYSHSFKWGVVCTADFGLFSYAHIHTGLTWTCSMFDVPSKVVPDSLIIIVTTIITIITILPHLTRTPKVLQYCSIACTQLAKPNSSSIAYPLHT
ncbi:hypothetical protein BO71DRAFT_71736 [Aspergillus ellipticus CBS 707.79]|uniref:Uncharacterized protein n=1 Tax=Aspergillus ellipticus CBS 707.79 TaxID=1448320 RepID=A0A319E3E6_9EURO|nr:hypothetical protein BO71DRAFT_71736 [Aspergillus ellipticus CBS 707.79]